MKKHVWLSSLLACLLIGCSPASQTEKIEGQIDVLPAFENLTELKVSHLGKSIRYVPLETTDSSLIGGTCRIHLLENSILATYGSRTESHCFLFDRKTGKFIREIGHKGQDPKGFSGSRAHVHPVTGHIYFQRTPNKLIKYNQEGEFVGDVTIPNGLQQVFYPLLTQEGILVYEEPNIFNAKKQIQLYYLDEVKGKIGDVLPFVQQNKELNAEDIQLESLRVLTGGLNKYGILGYLGLTELDFKNGTKRIEVNNFPTLWEIEDDICFHEAFSDTIYHVKDLTLKPYHFFNLGDKRHPVEERGKATGNEDKLTITYVLENKDLIYFQCAKNLYGDAKVYNGLYRKEDETVVMNEVQKAFTDDFTNFLPFVPITHTSKGEFVGLLTVDQIQSWQEEHPDAKLEGALAPLNNLDFDANPVVVIVEP